MRLPIGPVLVLALAAGPAAAQQGTFGGPKPRPTWTPGSPAAAPSKPKSYGAPAPGAPAAPGASAKPKTYGAPEAPGFKPYEGYKSQPGTSVFGPDGKKKR